jgi:hypothetical protein
MPLGQSAIDKEYLQGYAVFFNIMRYKMEKRDTYNLMSALEVGESFEAPEELRERLRGHCSRFRREQGKTFSIKRISATRCLVRRVGEGVEIDRQRFHIGGKNPYGSKVRWRRIEAKLDEVLNILKNLQ